jgi:hypothetical protein
MNEAIREATLLQRSRSLVSAKRGNGSAYLPIHARDTLRDARRMLDQPEPGADHMTRDRCRMLQLLSYSITIVRGREIRSECAVAFRPHGRAPQRRSAGEGVDGILYIG